MRRLPSPGVFNGHGNAESKETTARRVRKVISCGLCGWFAPLGLSCEANSGPMRSHQGAVWLATLAGCTSTIGVCECSTLTRLTSSSVCEVSQKFRRELAWWLGASLQNW